MYNQSCDWSNFERKKKRESENEKKTQHEGGRICYDTSNDNNKLPSNSKPNFKKLSNVVKICLYRLVVFIHL